MNDVSEWLTAFTELDVDTDNFSGIESKTKSHKLDLFKTILPAIDRGDKSFFKNLSQEEQDSIEPWIIMRFMTSAASNKDQPYFLLTVNDFVNTNFDLLTEKKTRGLKGHKELQWMLMCMCSRGRTLNRKFIKPAKGVIKNKLQAELIMLYPLLKLSEIDLLIEINTEDSLRKMFEENGYDSNYINELFN